MSVDYNANIRTTGMVAVGPGRTAQGVTAPSSAAPAPRRGGLKRPDRAGDRGGRTGERMR